MYWRIDFYRFSALEWIFFCISKKVDFYIQWQEWEWAWAISNPLLSFFYLASSPFLTFNRRLCVHLIHMWQILCSMLMVTKLWNAKILFIDKKIALCNFVKTLLIIYLSSRLEYDRKWHFEIAYNFFNFLTSLFVRG